MDALIASTYDELRLINARLDEAVTQAIELSVTNHGDLSSVSSDVDAIVDSLTSLRTAMTSLGDPSPQDLDVTGGAAPQAGPATSLPDPPQGTVQGSSGP